MTFEMFILTWNRLELLKHSLDSALRQTAVPMRITVMDNASDDGTAEYVRTVAECDKPFVYSSMGAGPVVRVLAPLYHYRLHGGQDSSASANGPYPDEILNLLEAQKAMFSPDSAQSKVFRTLSVLWMKSLYFWGGNPKSEWRSFHRRARSRGLVHGVFTKPWKHWIWRALADRTAKGYAESRPPRTKLIALKGGHL